MTTRNVKGMTKNLKAELELLHRHIIILRVLLRAREPIGILRLSDITGFSPHKVRYTLRTLEQENLIKPSTRGAEITDELQVFIEDLIGELAKIKDDINGLYKTVQKIREDFLR